MTRNGQQSDAALGRANNMSVSENDQSAESAADEASTDCYGCEHKAELIDTLQSALSESFSVYAASMEAIASLTDTLAQLEEEIEQKQQQIGEMQSVLWRSADGVPQ